MRLGHPVSLAGATREDIVASSVIKSSIIAMPRSESRVRGEENAMLDRSNGTYEMEGGRKRRRYASPTQGTRERCRPDTARATSGKVK